MILKHRDTEVLRLEWIEPEGVRIVSVNERATRFLPLDLHGQATDEGLWRWLRHRAVPKHRAYIAQFLSRLGIRNGDLRGILGFSRGLSLNDVHNGYGLFSLALYKNKYKDEFADLAGFAAARTPALYYPWLNIPGGITARMKSLALKLRGFRFRRHAHYNLPTERLRILEDFLQRRISEIAEYDSGNLEKSQIVSHGCTIKTKNERTDCTINRQLSEEFADRVKLNLKADPFITMDELANILRVSRRTVSNELKRLSDSNQIQRVGSRKTGHWKVIL